jgi:hypothetical protein
MIIVIPWDINETYAAYEADGRNTIDGGYLPEYSSTFEQQSISNVPRVFLNISPNSPVLIKMTDYSITT